MNLLFLMAATFAAFVFQTSLVPMWGAPAIEPQLVLGGLVWMVWRSESRTGVLMAAVWGAISDGLAQGPLGIDVVGFVLAAWVIQIIRSRHGSASALLSGALTGAVAFSVSATSAGVREFIEFHGVDLSLLLAWAGGKACTTAVVAFVLVLVRQIVMGRPSDTDTAMTARVSNRWRMLTE